MPDDRGILQAIGGILQKWNSRKKKKAVAAGLESKLKNPQSSLTKREQMLLNSRLLVDQIDERTDEGALMGLRASPIGRKLGI